MNMKKQKSIKKIVIFSLTGLLILFCSFCLCLYNGQLTRTKTKILDSFPFPMAIVNGHMIPMSEYTFRYSVSKQFDPTQSDTQIKASVYSSLIKQAELQQIAQKFGISVSTKELNEVFEAQKSQSGSIFNNSLNEYGINPDIFKDQFIKPQLLNINLQIWYNSNRNLNVANYNLAEDILNKIQAGQSMGSLATDYNQDQTYKATQGDMGFIDVATVLPELKEAISGMKIGEIKIVPSRNGLHILKIEEKKDNLTRLRQIFIKASGFDSWLTSETKKLSIKQLIKI